MNRPVSSPGAAAQKLNPAALEQARGFLATLFLGLRVAQTHALASRSFENASRLVLQSAGQLFKSTGGFSIQLGDSGALLNGQRLHSDPGADQAFAALKSLLVSGGMTSIEMRNAPTEASTRKLMLLFSASTRKSERPGEPRSALEPQPHALRTYAKLILALRGEPVRLQPVLQELVEIGAERPHHLLRLSLNDRGGTPAELLAVGSALIALVLGRALGLSREELVQLGRAALLHQKPVAKLAKDSPVCRSTQLSIAMVGERDQPNAHLFARIAAVAVRYRELVTDSTPLEAVTRLTTEEGPDPKIVDLLINVLRAFPIGTEVVLESDELGVVSEIGERWDRPKVRIEDPQGAITIDLATQADKAIAGTRAYVGGDRITLDDVEAPEIFDLSQLESIGVVQIDIEPAAAQPVTEVKPSEDVAPEAAEAEGPLEQPAAVSEPPSISEIDALKGRLDQRRRRDAERDRARRNSRIEHLSGQISEYRVERDELAEEAEALEDAANGAEHLAETVVVRQDDVDRTLAEMTPEIAERETKLEELWTWRQDLGDRASDLEHRALAARAEARDAEEKAAEADSEAQQRADRITEMELEIEQLRSERDDLDRAADTFRNAAIEEKRIAAEAESTAEAIRRDAQSRVPELTNHEEKLDLLRDRRLKLEAEKLALEQSASNAKSIAGEARLRVDEARARIAQADAAIEELEKGLGELREKMES